MRTLLVVLSIAVGIFAVAVMMGGRAVLIRSLDTSFPLTNPSSVTFGTTPFDEHLVDAVKRDSSVSDAQGRHTTSMNFRVNGGKWTSITLYAFKDYSRISVAKLEWPSGGKAPGRGQMLLEQGSFDFAGVKPGDTVELETVDKKHPTFTVTGSVHDLNAVAPMMSGSAVGYVSFDSLPDLQEPQSFNQLDVVASGHPATLDEVSSTGAHLRDKVIEPSGVTVLRMLGHKPGVQNVGDIFKAVTMLLVIVGAMTMVLSGFLVVNTIGALVTQQTRQLGVMKAVGARSGQLVAMFFVMVLSYGALGLLVAIPLGQLGSTWFANFGANQLDFVVRDYATPGPILAIELTVGLLVPLLAAAVPVVLGMRMPVRQALYSTGSTSSEFGEGLIDRILGKVRGLPRPVALALRNTFRRKGRLALTLITLTLAAGVFIAVASVNSSIQYTVDRFGQHRGMDVWATLAHPQALAAASQTALRTRGVTGVEGWIARSSVRLRPDGTESPALFVYGLPPGTKYLHPEIVSGRWLRAGDMNSIVIDSGFAKNDPDVKVGSVVTLKIRKVEQSFTVVGMSRGDLINEFAYVSRDYLDNRLSAGGDIETMMIGTSQHDAQFQSQVAKRLTDDFSARQMRIADTMTQRDLQRTISDSLHILVVFLVILAALLAAVGGIGLSGTMSINVLEATREIGVMRAVGASNASIYQIFITEGVVVGLVSWALGVVVSVPLSWGLTAALGQAMGFPLSFAYSPGGVAAWLGFVVVISVLASLLPAYRAARVSVAEAIAYE